MSSAASLTSRSVGSSANFSNGGSGSTTSIRTNNPIGKNGYNPFAPATYNRMSFKGSKDPVYLAYDYLDKQPLSKLVKDFVQEEIFTPMKRVFTA